MSDEYTIFLDVYYTSMMRQRTGPAMYAVKVTEDAQCYRPGHNVTTGPLEGGVGSGTMGEKGAMEGYEVRLKFGHPNFLNPADRPLCGPGQPGGGVQGHLQGPQEAGGGQGGPQGAPLQGRQGQPGH